MSNPLNRYNKIGWSSFGGTSEKKIKKEGEEKKTFK